MANFDMRSIYEMDDAGLLPAMRPPSIDEPMLDTQFGYEDMIEAPQPELQTLMPPKGPGIRQRLMGAIPGILNAGLIAAGTPNIAYGGPTDTVRAIFSGMQGAQNIDATRQAQQMEIARRRAETEATIATRRAQAEAAEAAKQRALREERFINVGGAVFDKHTQKYLSPKEALFAQDFDRWRKQAIEIGLKPNTPEYQHYLSTGKLPDWYGKPETKSGSQSEPKPKVTVSAKWATDHNIVVPEGQPTIEIDGTIYTNLVKADKSAEKNANRPGPGAMTESQRHDREERRREKFARIEKTKMDRLLKAEDEFSSGDIDANELQRRKRAAQVAYESEIIAAGGSVARPSPAVDAAPSPASPGPTLQLPPEASAALQEGVNTTFGNGQVWTKRGGRPQRVK